MTNDAAVRAEEIRDLRDQVEGLRAVDNPEEVIFRDVSPRTTLQPLYSMVNGEEILLPRHMLERVLQKRLPTGSYMFTSQKEKAPVYKPGTTRCFLHPESPERDVLNDIGLGGTFCPADSLANSHSKRIHAQHRHRNEWAAYEEHLKEQREALAREQQTKQTDAMLALAGSTVEPKHGSTCQSCGEPIIGKLKDHVCKDEA